MIKFVAGGILARMFPTTALQVEQSFTMPYFGNEATSSIIGRLIRAHLGRKGRHDQQKLEKLHKNFWRAQRPSDWFSSTSSRLHNLYVPIFGPLIEQMHSELVANRIERVVEFGTGNGDWLAWLRSTWHFPRSFLGIDIAKDQINENQQRHADLSFVASDITEWVSENKGHNTLFLTHCGVLEYLSESSLQNLLQSIRQNHQTSMVFFVEPIAADFNLDTEHRSRLQGREFSFSHNYPKLLAQAGFEVLHTSELEVDEYRMLCTLAKLTQPCRSFHALISPNLSEVNWSSPP